MGTHFRSVKYTGTEFWVGPRLKMFLLVYSQVMPSFMLLPLIAQNWLFFFTNSPHYNGYNVYKLIFRCISVEANFSRFQKC